MTPDQIDRVFGRGRLKMVTGDHVEVFREASLPGRAAPLHQALPRRPRPATSAQWTEREWRILARLVGHGIGPVPDVVQFDRGAADRPALVQTYDAGVTVDQWATLLPLERDGRRLRHVFEDCAHWWALAHHCLIALDAIHALAARPPRHQGRQRLHPASARADFDPHSPAQRLRPSLRRLALIDFAFSLVSGERLAIALPIARQTEYDYQSPRLLRALEAGRAATLADARARLALRPLQPGGDAAALPAGARGHDAYGRGLDADTACARARAPPDRRARRPCRRCGRTPG